MQNTRDKNIVISFNNEELIPDLFGQFDKNLRRIESLLNVNLHGRGKNVSISGNEVNLAQKVLHDLYDQLKDGFEIGFEEIDASIRMNSVKNNLSKNIGTDNLLIKTVKKNG